MFIYALIGLINAITGTILGLFVYFKNRRVKINQSFSLLCLSVAVWSYAYYFWQMANNANSALFWSRSLMVGAIFIPICYFHFILRLLNKFQEKKKALIFGYLIFFFFFLANFTSLFVEGVSSKMGFAFWPDAGVLYLPFLLIWFFYAIYAVYLLLKEYFISSGIKHSQIRYVFIATIIGYLGGATNYLLWYDIPVPPIGNWTTVLYLSIIAYAIVKRKLFEIKVVLTQLLVGTMAVILTILPFLVETFQMKILTTGILLVFSFIGYLLIKSVRQEIKSKEELKEFNITLEEKVKKRTKELELEKKYAETQKEIAEERTRRLERWYNLTVGRELKMMELKKKIKKLEKKPEK